MCKLKVTVTAFNYKPFCVMLRGSIKFVTSIGKVSELLQGLQLITQYFYLAVGYSAFDPY